MDKIRVLLANSPMMVPDAFRDLIEQQDDMEMVGDCRGPMKILQDSGRMKADVVILVQEGAEEPGLCSQLLAIYPDLIILGVFSDMLTVFTHKISSQRCDLDDAGNSQMKIIEAMRLAVRDRQLSQKLRQT